MPAGLRRPLVLAVCHHHGGDALGSPSPPPPTPQALHLGAAEHTAPGDPQPPGAAHPEGLPGQGGQPVLAHPAAGGQQGAPTGER